MESIIKEGNLHKEGGGAITRWQQRWFRLTSKSFSWHKSKDDTQQQGSVAVNEIVAVEKLVGERSSRQNCFSLGVAGKDKVYQLAADSKEERDAWVEVLNSSSISSTSPLSSSVKYVTVETYSSHGVRVTGDPGNLILTQIGSGLASDKKRRDERGWFCDRHLPLNVVLNLFAQHGWILVRTYESESISSLDGSTNPCNVAIFCKDATSFLTSPTAAIAPSVITRNLVPTNNRPLSAFRPLNIIKDDDDKELIEGADDELAKLMQEFNIPLDLLYTNKAS
ncbi:uncharacterized protein LOC134178624 [Corticium candelabrum]|uniref:uncharacterized protein LOC134178624 n=1 Tax=Corticium candelabrum TaxID=121492 RepID=UPI002E2726AB|nr:uncharacterized protein LOC134178624 [Corticium candelabrum]